MSAMVIRAIYEDGVFKPLDPLSLNESQVVELTIEPKQTDAPLVKLAGLWAKDGIKLDLSFEEMQAFLHSKQSDSLDRLFRQLDGDFDGDS